MKKQKTSSVDLLKKILAHLKEKSIKSAGESSTAWELGYLAQAVAQAARRNPGLLSELGLVDQFGFPLDAITIGGERT